MKKNLLLSAFAMILMLAFMPMHFYGQEKAPEAKTSKSNVFDPYFHVFGEAGLSLFNGDLNMYGFLADPAHFKFNAKLGAGYQFTPVFGAFAKVGMGAFGGEKDQLNNGKVVNAIIDESKFVIGSINASFNMVNLFAGYNPDRMFDFGLHIGVGQINWQARAVDITSNLPFDPEIGYGTNDIEKGWLGDRASAWTVPVGAEFTYHASPKVDVYADYTFNFSDSDRLDAFTDNGADDRHWPEGTYQSDLFASLNFGLRYKFVSTSIKSMVDNFDDVTFVTTPNPLEERGDSVEVTIKGTFPPKYFKKNAVMNFTPVLMYDGGSVALKTVNFKGEGVAGDGTPVNYSNGGTFTYTDKIPYHPNMKVSELVVAPLVYPAKTITNITREDVRTNEAYLAVPQRKLQDGVIYTSKRIADDFKTSTAPHGYEKVTVIADNAAIYYLVNQHNLNLSLPLNKLEANKEALKNVTQNLEKGFALKDITVDGWASPEGEETFNEGLSEKRATTAVNYLNGEVKTMLRKKDNILAVKDVKDLNFEKSGNGPDWNGFMAAVEASGIKDKNAILNVIRSANPAQREQEIRNMILIYPELEKDILPPLRRAIITVNTLEPKKTDEAIANLSTTDPSQLTLNELLYAATLTEDHKTQQMIYASAMNIHPKCMRAVLNAADVEISLGNIAEGKKLLEKAATMTDKSAAVYNNLAVVAIYERDFTTAETHLNKAKQLGANVDYNMGVLNIYKGDYSKAISLMNSEKCDYNLGLAQLLNKDFNAAKATLDCAEGEKVAYLKAVLAARMGNNADVYSNLMKAIQKDENYKKVAKTDLEFMKLFGEPDFQAIVK